ncbi:MAG: PEGA domain-containing protein [Proteobacteria bacterium]|nr:PEGA domain-containing protein [Pseudomonadota bacterium]
MLPLHAEPVGVVARSAAAAPVSAGKLAESVAAAVRGAGAAAETDPFARARSHLDRGAVPAERLTAFTRARNLVRDGWRAYAAVDTGLAMERLTRARDVAREVLDLDGGLVLYADIALRIGAVELAMGRASEAAQSFRTARALDSERRISIASFAPDVVAAFRAATTGEAELISVRLNSDPAGAQVEVDGRYVGQAPVAIRAGPGNHVIVARAPGHRAAAHILALGQGLATPADGLTVSLEPDAELAALAQGAAGLAIAGPSQRIRAALAALIRYGELAGVVVVASLWQGGQPALFGQYCAGLPATCTRIVEIRYPSADLTRSACAELWATLRSAPLQTPPGLLRESRLVAAEGRPVAPVSAPGIGHRGCRLCRKPWLWIGVGAAIAAAGATWLALSPGQGRPVVRVDPCDFGRCPDR